MARLLLIDDDAQLRNMAAEVLREAGHEIIQAASGPAGIEAAQRAHPDLVLCDVSMAGMDGFAVLARFRGDPRFASVPFLFLTGLAAEEHARAALNLGADDYLTKPVTNDDLVNAVSARLARREITRRETERRVADLQRSIAFLLPHELRTPLTVILGGSELLRDLCRELEPDEIAQAADAIARAGQRLSRMFENYLVQVGLELTRLGSAEMAPSAFAGRCPPKDVETSARERAREHGREGDLDLELGEVDLPLAPVYAGKVVSELVDNALKFSTAGQRVLVRSAASGERVMLEVVDHGRGMTAEQLAERAAFRQFDRARFEQQGVGLGLAVVKGIVEASGGTLDVSSTPGVETTASVTWSA
jgi:signal transduction histidine kinase